MLELIERELYPYQLHFNMTGGLAVMIPSCLFLVSCGVCGAGDDSYERLATELILFMFSYVASFLGFFVFALLSVDDYNIRCLPKDALFFNTSAFNLSENTTDFEKPFDQKARYVDLLIAYFIGVMIFNGLGMVGCVGYKAYEAVRDSRFFSASRRAESAAPDNEPPRALPVVTPTAEAATVVIPVENLNPLRRRPSSRLDNRDNRLSDNRRFEISISSIVPNTP